MYADTNRKKVRGWRRRVRALARWRERSLHLDFDASMRRGAHHARLELDPWNRLTPRNPPMWYRRLALAALVAIHARWHARLASLGVPFVLRLWLMHPRFHSSQVVAAIGAKMERYAGLFLSFPDVDPAPLDLYRSAELPLDEFIWSAGIDYDPIFEQACELSQEEIGRYVLLAFHVERSDDETVHLLDRGTVWVGEWREGAR